MEHYRCVEVYNPKTNGTAIDGTFKWSDTNPSKQPKITFEEQLTMTAHDLSFDIKISIYAYYLNKIYEKISIN